MKNLSTCITAIMGALILSTPMILLADLQLISSTPGNKSFVLSYVPKPVNIRGSIPSLPPDLQDLVSEKALRFAEGKILYPSSSTFIPLEYATDSADWLIEADEELLSRATLTPAQQGNTYGLFLTVAGSKKSPSGTFTLTSIGSSQPISATKATPAVLSLPLGSQQLLYSGPAGIRQVSLEDLPNTATPQLLWHGATLSFGGELAGNRWFYAPYNASVSAEHDAIFVNPISASPSPMMTSRPAFSTLSPESSEVAIPRSVLHEPALTYERAAPLPLGTRTVIYRIAQGQTKQTTVSLVDAVTTAPIEITIGVAGLNTVGNDPEHIAYFSIEDEAETGQAAWGGRTTATATLRLNEAPLPDNSGAPPAMFTNQAGEKKNTAKTPFPPAPLNLVINHSVPISTISSFVDLQLLDYIYVEYQGFPRVQGGTAHLSLNELTSPVPRLVTIGGFPLGTTPEQVLLLDVTTPTAPVQILGAQAFSDSTGGVALEFEAGPGAAQFVAQLVTTLPPPVAMQPTPQLPTLPPLLKGIYVCSPELQPALAPLLAHRGEGYVVLDPAAAYAVYNNGQESPEALRDALAALVAAAPNRVDFPTILLVGHATFDPANLMGLKTGPQVPTFIEESVDTGFTIENSIDFPYGLLAGNDQLQDAQVGRLPVRDAAELTIAINRIIAFETQLQPLQHVRPALFVTDDDADILPDAALWPQLFAPTGTPYTEIVIDTLSNGAAEQVAFADALAQGPAGVSLVLYTGHGNTTFWASERIITTQEVPNLLTENKWPIVATFTCLNGNYAVPNATLRSLGEAWLITPNGGALANLTPCSVDFYLPQKNFSVLFLNTLAEPQSTRPKTIGDALTRTRVAHTLAYPDQGITNNLYLLFGDPDSPLVLLPADSHLQDQWHLF
ncbi:MAG: C25 family cysteine peptidase [Sumerlaeia bacterium]